MNTNHEESFPAQATSAANTTSHQPSRPVEAARILSGLAPDHTIDVPAYVLESILLSQDQMRKNTELLANATFTSAFSLNTAVPVLEPETKRQKTTTIFRDIKKIPTNRLKALIEAQNKVAKRWLNCEWDSMMWCR